MPTSALCRGVPAPAPWGLERTGGHKGHPNRNTGRPQYVGAILVVARPAGRPPAVAVYPGMNRESGGEHMKIIVDAMGGDNAPVSNVRGALAAVRELVELVWPLIYLKPYRKHEKQMNPNHTFQSHKQLQLNLHP